MTRQEQLRQAAKRWRESHKDQRRREWRARIRATKMALIEALGGRCMDCGTTGHPAIFDFDHRDPSTKSFGIGERQSASLEVLLAEARKCDLVCANCHRVRTVVRHGI